MPALNIIKFEGTSGERWEFTGIDIDCLLLTVYHGEPNLHYLMRCLQILKYRNPLKYNDFDESTLEKVLDDHAKNFPGHLAEWRGLRPTDPRIGAAKDKYRHDSRDGLRDLSPKLEVAERVEQIPDDVLIMIAILRNNWIEGANKGWDDIAKGLNVVFPSFKAEGKPFSQENVEIILRCLVLSTHHDIYRQWALDINDENINQDFENRLLLFDNVLNAVTGTANGSH
ncbi:MAG: hypothetical protein LQ342_007692 [Letrouitia transgressa]|nr:MAG: hypothetical protein LQ342_007692 [Letrouitia transgressa]